MSYKPYKAEDYRIQNSIQLIEDTYGDVVSVDAKKKNLIKFGRNDNLDNSGFQTIWLQGGDEVYATGNDIDTISSSNAGDTQVIKIEGHTISGSDLTFVVQTATLNGQNKVVLTTPLHRASRLENTGATGLAGDVYIYEDDTITGGVPDTPANVHLKAESLDNQSLKCSTSISSMDYWIITSVVGSADRNSQVRIVDFKLQLRPMGGVFKTKYPFTASTSSGSRQINFEQPIIVPKNYDVRVIAESSGTSTIAQAAIHGYLASITS